MNLKWTERLIPGHAALALCAYLGDRCVAAIDECYDEGKPVHAVYLATNPRQAAALCETQHDAQAYVERLIQIARAA